MKTLYKCFALLLALGCYQVSFSNPPPQNPPPAPSVSIRLSGSSNVCPGSAFTATATVANTSTSGLSYEWSVAIGTANGSRLLVSPSNTATIRVDRPFEVNRGNITVRVLRNGGAIADKTIPVTVLPNTVPARPGVITITNDNPGSPTNSVICQNSTVTFSVPTVTGANQYRWTVGSSTTTTSSRSFTTFLTTTGNNIPVSVVAVGCAGSSAASTASIFVIPANQSPCNDNQFSRTASSSDKLSVSTYPNPVNDGALKVDVSQDYLLSSAQLIDQKTGKTVKSFTIEDQESLVATDDLPKGTYLLKLQNKEGTLTRRIVVE